MNRTILLADEDAPVRLMLARVLKAAGYDVVLAASPRDAVTEAQHGKPDLVLLDLKTPEPESWQAFEEIRRVAPSVPVVATTAWSNQQEQAFQRGIDTLMEKPLDLNSLLAIISQLLKESAQARKDRREKRQADLIRAAA